MIRICETLAAMGYQVRLIGRKRKTSKPLVERGFEQLRLSCFFQQGKWFYLEYNIRLWWYLLLHRFDAVCAVDLDTILPVLWISSLKSKPRLYDAHEYFTEVPEVVRRPQIQRIWARVARYAIPKFKHCYTVGPALARIFEERYGVAFEVIRNVPVRQATEAVIRTITAEQPIILLYQGALNEGRGIEFLLQAMPLLPKHVKLWLVGEGDLSEALRTQAVDLQLGAQVKFWGYVQPEDLKAITAQATIGFNLLENKGLSYYYSLANKAFDYLQAGIPSVQMDFPEYQNLQQQYEVFVLLSELDPSSIAEAVRQLADPASGLYHRLAQNCRLAATEWNWEREQLSLELIYRQIME
ncbi:MAG: glycosyltransferase [Phaeodactylibacter sp.]|nr:glycosyltransferase [Phaeodactylibacter sp.]